MPDSHSIENDFLSKIIEIIEENISNERFGVSELAHEIGMSRSNLLRKIKKLTKLSVSQFIRQVRLRHAMEMLRQTSLTVSEISYKVGFSSTSYFIKCFHDYYSYPPGEVGKRDLNESDSNQIGQPSQSHQLAAIMFTDIQGYTALMQQDEVKALEFRKRHREVFNAVTKKFKGKILQYYGDGTLSTFNSAIDAVRCGIELQQAFREEPQIPVRIGVHSGDIIFTEDDIIGDGVNVASRIESLAAVGSVFISEKVYDEVKNQPGIQTTSMGKFELKNVGKPMEVFAITNPGLVVPKRDQIIRKVKSESLNNNKEFRAKRKRLGIKWGFIILAAILVGYLVYTAIIFEITKQFIPSDQTITKKSIAVLPFINDSNDSTNVYIINGLMESILNNLQKIEDLRVISRTSVEKYRNNPKTIPDIAKELNVNYFVEGSGQKIGDQILLNIQLIEAPSDKHLWSEQYNREAKEIFKLQMDVAKNIADEIQAIITPEEEERINKVPTDDLVAYDYFLKGLDLLNKPSRENLEDAIPYFKKAIEHDNEFARAYAAVAIAYYLLDENQAEKKYSAQINHYADKALLFNSQLPQSLIAKALFYMNNEEYELAVSYFEKALEYNPNYDLVFVFLVKLYVDHLPNTEKYLEYALRGIKIDIAAYDSITTSFIYLHLSNAFIQSGFINEAEKYINKSLEYHPKNLYSAYVKAFILYARNRDLQQTKDLLIEALNKDSTRLDIMQEIGKICYFMRDYESAYFYYKKYIEIKEALNLDIYRYENVKIGVVLSKIGLTEESEKYFREYKDYAENDKSIYKHLTLAAYYSYKGDTEKAIEHLKIFSQQNNYHYWTVIFTQIDPLVDNIKDLPEFKEIMNDIETKFWNNHKQMKASLEEKELL
ncbi:MAG: helix-turn-helix domain-containing protein [Bacteroidales bacterium]|nr:helix-turn-helix domain-containing protein [Bacteroidales bacterium]